MTLWDCLLTAEKTHVEELLSEAEAMEALHASRSRPSLTAASPSAGLEGAATGAPRGISSSASATSPAARSAGRGVSVGAATPPPGSGTGKSPFSSMFRIGQRKKVPEYRERLSQLAAAQAEWARACGEAFAPFASKLLRRSPAGYAVSLATRHGIAASALQPKRMSANGASGGTSAGGAGSAPHVSDEPAGEVDEHWASGDSSMGTDFGKPGDTRFCGLLRPLDVAFSMRQAVDELMALLKALPKPVDAEA